jgi:hypothetical protein
VEDFFGRKGVALAGHVLKGLLPACLPAGQYSAAAAGAIRATK